MKQEKYDQEQYDEYDVPSCHSPFTRTRAKTFLLFRAEVTDLLYVK